MNPRSMPTKTLFLWIGIILLAIMSGCGGGGQRGRNTDGGGGTPAEPQAQRIELLPAPASLPSSGAQTTDVDAIVADENSNALADETVTFTLNDPAGTATLSFPNGRDTNDEGSVTARLNIGSNKSNRSISVTARADNTSSTATVDVIGTEITISGITSLVLGATTVLDISLKDAAGNAIAAAPLTVTSSRGNNLSATNLVTSAAGQTQVTVTGTQSGTDTITVTGFGTTASTTLSVSGSNFTFVSPSPAGNADILVGSSPTTVRVRWIESAVPQVGRLISFSATRGTLSALSATTNASGEAEVTITSPSTGPTIVTATAPTGTPTASLSFNFITNSAATVNLQADRNTIPVNEAGSTTNRATLTATVRDAANNLVKNARVAFTQVSDPSNGSLSTGIDITDADGKATVDYIAGPQTSGQNAVLLRATVLDVNGVAPGSTIQSPDLQVTVGGQSLFIRMQTDNTIEKNEATVTYRKRYVAIVSDSAGNAPTTPVTVQFKINPAQPPSKAYFKGSYPSAPANWVRVQTAACDNEDQNLNGILDLALGEDNNNNGLLEPGNVATVNTNVATDSLGLAVATIVYPQGFATWVQVSLEAKVQVAGTESVAVNTFILPVSAADLTGQAPPPGATSPFGTGTSCNDTL